MATPTPEQVQSTTLTKVIRFRAKDAEVERLKAYARSRDVTMSVALRQMIREALSA